jgi:uncharacterized membrane protein
MSNSLSHFYPSAGQWLRLSMGWTAACLAACVLFNLLLNSALPTLSDEAGGKALLVSAGVAHSLIWWQAVLGGNAIIRREEQQQDFTWTRLAANLWLVVLTLFQLLCLFGLLLLAVLLHSEGALIGRFGD